MHLIAEKNYPLKLTGSGDKPSKQGNLRKEQRPKPVAKTHPTGREKPIP